MLRAYPRSAVSSFGDGVLESQSIQLSSERLSVKSIHEVDVEEAVVDELRITTKNFSKDYRVPTAKVKNVENVGTYPLHHTISIRGT
jgi:hypothetical protein